MQAVKKWPRALAGAVVASILASSAVALGQDPPAEAPASPADADADKKERAKNYYYEGKDKLALNDLAGALLAFREAERLVPAPSITIWVARCHARLDQLVEAKASAKRAVDFPVQPGEPEQYAPARSDAAAMLIELEERIPTITVWLRDGDKPWPAGKASVVSIDNVPITEQEWVRYGVNPGSHDVSASAEGYRGSRTTVQLKPREREVVSLEMRPLFQPPPVAPPPPPEAPPEDTTPMELPPTFAMIGLGVGAAGVIVGSITGGLALSSSSDAEAACPDGVCSEAGLDPLDDSRLYGEISNASFGAAFAGVSTGLVDWIAPGDPASDGLRPVTWAGFGVAGAGTIVAVITGALSLSAKSSAEGECPAGGVCSDAAREDEASARTLGGICTLSAGAAVVGAGMGLGSFLAGAQSNSRGDSPPSSSPQSNSRGDSPPRAPS